MAMPQPYIQSPHRTQLFRIDDKLRIRQHGDLLSNDLQTIVCRLVINDDNFICLDLLPNHRVKTGCQGRRIVAIRDNHRDSRLHLAIALCHEEWNHNPPALRMEIDSVKRDTDLIKDLKSPTLIPNPSFNSRNTVSRRLSPASPALRTAVPDPRIDGAQPAVQGLHDGAGGAGLGHRHFR
jgi:hypothetical protein